jgi:hypothetical protein
MKYYISAELRTLVVQRAGNRCEYCRLPEHIGRIPFEADHIIAIKHRGKTTPENLAYTCPRCNRLKGSDLTTVLHDDDTPIRLFNPRKHVWSEHFRVENGLVYGKTLVGEATATLLDFNAPERVMARILLIEAGLYP